VIDVTTHRTEEVLGGRVGRQLREGLERLLLHDIGILDLLLGAEERAQLAIHHRDPLMAVRVSVVELHRLLGRRQPLRPSDPADSRAGRSRHAGLLACCSGSAWRGRRGKWERLIEEALLGISLGCAVTVPTVAAREPPLHLHGPDVELLQQRQRTLVIRGRLCPCLCA
jgi:hypothetical protein